MINKQNVWFITLFSLILVLSIYYLTMPDNLLKDITTNKDNSKEVININESEILTALRVQSDEEVLQEMNTLQQILLDEGVTSEEKSKAYDSLKELNLNKGKEQTIEQKILATHDLKSFVKIKNDQVKVVVIGTEHSTKLANDIIRTVQSNFDTTMYITVQFKNS